MQFEIGKSKKLNTKKVSGILKKWETQKIRKIVTFTKRKNEKIEIRKNDPYKLELKKNEIRKKKLKMKNGMMKLGKIVFLFNFIFLISLLI